MKHQVKMCKTIYGNTKTDIHWKLYAENMCCTTIVVKKIKR